MLFYLGNNIKESSIKKDSSNWEFWDMFQCLEHKGFMRLLQALQFLDLFSLDTVGYCVQEADLKNLVQQVCLVMRKKVLC